MSVPEQSKRQDPAIKMQISQRLNELIEKSGLDKSVIAFRAGWTRSRMSNYTSGLRTPGIEELIDLDKVLEPILGPYASFYIVYGQSLADIKDGFAMPEITKGDINKAVGQLLSDYEEMGRIKMEPKLTPQKMLDDLNSVYLPQG